MLDRSNIVCKPCQVVSVSLPRYENKLGQQPLSVVDLTIIADGSSKTYVVPDSATKAYADNVIISSEKDSVIAEIRAIKQSSDNIINSIEKHREISEKCNTMLLELDTEFKTKKETDERITNIESKIENLTKLIQERLRAETPNKSAQK